MTPKQQRFVDEYLVDLNATQAAIRAGYSKKTARSQACENLTKPDIQSAIAKARLEQQKRTGITADKVLQEAWNIVTADVRELIQVRVGCCRHCYGKVHRYQRTQVEYDRDYAKFLGKRKDHEFEEQGGIGFDLLLPPAKGCPMCCGDGHARIVVSDTGQLSPAAAALYSGAKQTRDGFEIKLHDKLAALEKVFRHLGLYEHNNGQKTDDLTDLLYTITHGNNSTFKPVVEDPERLP